MKNMFSVVASLLFLFTPSLYASNNLAASLVEVKTYKGDDGKHIQCSSKSILVQEIFEIPNVSLKGIVMAHAAKKGSLHLYQRNWKIKGTNHIEYGFCASPGYKEDLQVRFINTKGESSNLLSFTIDTNKIKPLEASAFPALVSIE
jgi:hypothetical protein